MAKRVHEYGVAECIGAEPLHEKKENWAEWRARYVGLEGWLDIYESENHHPGMKFFYFYGGDESEQDWHLQAYCHQIDERSDGRIVFITENSRYEFQLRSSL